MDWTYWLFTSYLKFKSHLQIWINHFREKHMHFTSENKIFNFLYLHFWHYHFTSEKAPFHVCLQTVTNWYHIFLDHLVWDKDGNLVINNKYERCSNRLALLCFCYDQLLLIFCFIKLLWQPHYEGLVLNHKFGLFS